MYNQGISKVGDILDISVAEEIVDKRGAFFSYGDTRLAQGRENAKNFLMTNPDMTFEIENKIRAKFGLPLRDPSTIDYGLTGSANEAAEESVEQVDE
jgi:recombination protein RecA